MEFGRVFTDSISVPERLRQLDEQAVEQLAESISEIGLQQPITVYAPNENEAELVAGAHRLAAARRLGWGQIDAVLMDASADERQLWEIDENLMRSELSQAEYSRHVALRKEVYERLHGTAEENRAKAAAEARWSDDAQRQVGGKHPDPFTADTAAKTGKSERSVQRAAHRGERIAEDVLARIKGTRFDTGSYQDQLAKLDHDAQREKVEDDLAEPARPKSNDAPKRRQQQAEDRDLSEEAANKIAAVLAEHVPGEHWDGLKANLYQCSGKQVAKALSRLTGVSVFDNTDSGRAA